MDSIGGETGGGAADALLAAVAELVDRPLAPLPDREVVELLRGVEQAARMLVAVQHRLVIEADRRSIPEQSGVKTIKRFLMETLRLSHAEAGARVHAARWVGTFCDLRGAERAPELPCTATALKRGDISAEHARGIVAVMKRVPHGVDAADRAAAERVLVEFAVSGSPDDIGKVGDAVLTHLDPDGRITDEIDRARMRGIRIGRQRPDGMSPISGDIDPMLRVLLDTFLAKYARPGVANLEDPASPGVNVDKADRSVIAAAAQRDTRSAEQRTHDALTLLLSDLVDAERLGAHRGIPMTTIVTIRLEDLERAAGLAEAATGTVVPVEDLLRVAERSRPYLAVFDHAGLPLHLGRARRLGSMSQRLSLIASLRGCSRPGCDAPASMCAVHHVRDFSKGGNTDVGNLVLACDHCHSLIKDGDNGWRTVVLGKDSQFPGRTAWIAPWHIDPTGTPRVNHRHYAAELLAHTATARGRAAYPRAAYPRTARVRTARVRTAHSKRDSATDHRDPEHRLPDNHRT